MKRTIPKLATATIASCLVLGLATPAMAQDDAAGGEEHRHPDLKAHCQEAIDQRLDHLAHTQSRVDEVLTLSEAHEAAIDDIIDGTQSGLTLLANQVESAADRPTAIELCSTVAPDYRVYLVVLPQTHLTLGADRAQVSAEVGYAVINQIDDAIAKAAAAGADVGDAQMYRDQSLAHLQAADKANDGVADSVLAVTPTSYNEGTDIPVLEEARTSLRLAHAELEGANETGIAAAKALRDALGATV